MGRGTLAGRGGGGDPGTCMGLQMGQLGELQEKVWWGLMGRQ